MSIDGWQYYNHAMIPTTPPHVDPNITPIENKSIWKSVEGKTPLLARWTTDFDCGYETNWWYVIKDAPFNIDDVSAKDRKSIRQALNKCYVKKVDSKEYLDLLYDCYLEAFKKYENAEGVFDKREFIASLKNSSDCWCGFDRETNSLIGYMTVVVCDIHAEIRTARFNPLFSNKRVSDALYYHVLDYYLNECKKEYVSSGERSINHKSNTQDYKMRRFGYRKAYCHLHLLYNPKFTFAVKIAFFFRKILKRLDRITLIHLINAVLMMEELRRMDVSTINAQDHTKNLN